MTLSATDNLGAHLLGRRPMPHDPRDYKLEDYLDAYDRITAAYQPGMTLQQVADEHDLAVWHDVYAFWAWFKNQFLNQPGPAPTPPSPTPPTPTPPSPAPSAKPTGGWHDTDDPVLDQGQTPHCVGFTGADTGNAGLPDEHYRNADGNRIYYLCQPGDINVPISQQQGSDSRTLCKVLVGQGVIGSYAFAAKIETVIQFVQQHGSIGSGSEWLNDMFTPDEHNYLPVTGSSAGGHEYSYVDYSELGYNGVSEPSFKLLNHWGTSWGHAGYAYVRASDVEKLMFSNQGDGWAGLRKVA